jgi:radical SAM protein with 4Fe4S-binding SPASM domain
MSKLSVEEVTLIGGEAYLRKDWVDIVRAVRAHGMMCTMTTGGRGLTRTLARSAVEAGVQACSVSIDGVRETHDALRGRGSYDCAIAAIRHLREAGVRVTANTQINKHTLPQLEAIHEILAVEHVQGWQVQLTAAMGRAADRPELLLDPWQVLELMPTLSRIALRFEETGVRLWPGNNIGYFGPYEAVLRAHYPQGYRGSCGAGRVTLGIEANGDVKGCPSLPTDEYVGGNIREHTLADIWERSERLRFTRQRAIEDLWGYCRTCYYAEACLGGCNWTTHVLFGRPGNNPYCHHRALELMKQRRRERLVQTHAAEGRPFDHGLFDIVEEVWPDGDPFPE